MKHLNLNLILPYQRNDLNGSYCDCSVDCAGCDFVAIGNSNAVHSVGYFDSAKKTHYGSVDSDADSVERNHS